jgi:hypothetical protein
MRPSSDCSTACCCSSSAFSCSSSSTCRPLLPLHRGAGGDMALADAGAAAGCAAASAAAGAVAAAVEPGGCLPPAAHPEAPSVPGTLLGEAAALPPLRDCCASSALSRATASSSCCTWLRLCAALLPGRPLKDSRCTGGAPPAALELPCWPLAYEGLTGTEAEGRRATAAEGAAASCTTGEAGAVRGCTSVAVSRAVWAPWLLLLAGQGCQLGPCSLFASSPPPSSSNSSSDWQQDPSSAAPSAGAPAAAS